MALWRDSYDTRTKTIDLMDYLLSNTDPGRRLYDLHPAFKRMFAVTGLILVEATPFAWSAETTTATLQASASIPVDTPLDRWNLDTGDIWWYFEQPLELPIADDVVTVKALCAGWDDKYQQFVVSILAPVDGKLVNDDGNEHRAVQRFQPGLIPSQIWTWFKGETIQQMATRLQGEHAKLYGENKSVKTSNNSTVMILNSDDVAQTTTTLSRFILAGLTWLQQKVVVTEDHYVDRHEQRRVQRVEGRRPLPVKLVYLRRTEQKERAEGEPTGREYSCRWGVDPHWRLQACGPQHQGRKLIYIYPYVKGPSDKPFRAKPTVYVVSR